MGESQLSRDSAGGLREAGVGRGRPVRFMLNGKAVEAYAGESVAAAVLAAGQSCLRDSPRLGQPRGAFCWMGLCQECTMVIDGLRQPSCRVACRDGLVVHSGTIA